MPWSQEWLVPERVVFTVFSGKLTYQDIRETFDNSAILVNSCKSDARVHFLHDWTQLEHFPRNLQLVSNALSARVENPKRLGHVVMYGHQSPILHFISDIALRLLHIRFHVTDNAADAILKLHRLDETLPHFERSCNNAFPSDLL